MQLFANLKLISKMLICYLKESNAIPQLPLTCLKSTINGSIWKMCEICSKLTTQTPHFNIFFTVNTFFWFVHCYLRTSKYQLVMFMLDSLHNHSHCTHSLVYSIKLIRSINCFNFAVAKIQNFDPKIHKLSLPWASIFIPGERNYSHTNVHFHEIQYL